MDDARESIRRSEVNCVYILVYISRSKLACYICWKDPNKHHTGLEQQDRKLMCSLPVDSETESRGSSEPAQRRGRGCRRLAQERHEPSDGGAGE